MRRRQFMLGLGGAAIAAPFPSFAQQEGRLARVGFLGSETPSEYARNIEALRAGLHALGYVEGKNLRIEFRWAEGKYDRLPALAAELVGSKVDVIVTHGTPGTFAAKRATATIPIVMASSGDAVGTGLISSLSRPDGNITGMTLLLPELSAKRLELLKLAAPGLARVGSLFNPLNPAYATDIAKTDEAAKTLKVQVQRFGARRPQEFEAAFAAMDKARIEAVLVHQDGMINANPGAIANLARKHRMLSAGFEEFGEAGGLIGYGVSFPRMYQRTATYVDKLLKGIKVRDLPVEQPTEFNLIV
ncbi:MAG TPA: ABC transporter substrate-binding protein, partial [Burkholderiales bacterium]|nr:ABC transporter substrate-binding protein [Burkholderiales bacterium]